MRSFVAGCMRKAYSGVALPLRSFAFLLGCAALAHAQADAGVCANAGGPLPLVHVSVVAADGGSLAGARLFIDWGGQTDSAAADAGGRFVAPLRQSLDDSVAMTVVAGHGYYPVHLRAPRVPCDTIAVVAVPRRWAIRTGIYAGDTVDVSPSAALRSVGQREHFGRIASGASAPHHELVSWPVERLPIPFAIHRMPGTYISAADSLALWGTVTSFESEVGIDSLFRPAGDSLVDAQGWGMEIHVDPALAASGLTWDTWGSEGRIFDASIRVRRARDFGDASILYHELLHALGFGHTSAWRSIMAKEVSDDMDRLTPEDVAYAQLLLRMAALQRATGASYALEAAAEGERRERGERHQ